MIGHSSNIVNKGLIFLYDQRSIRSYKGPAITNVATEITPRGQGETTYYKFYSGTDTQSIPSIGKVTYPYMDMYNDYGGGSGNCCPSPFGYGSNLAVIGSTLYTYGIVYRSANRYTNANLMYHYEYNSSGGYLTEFGVHGVGGYSWQETHLGNGWYWSRSKFTTQPTAAIIHTGAWMYQYATWNRWEIAKVLIAAGDWTNTHPSLWPATGETRSTAQAIVDLTGSTTVTATSVTYDNDGKFGFNGSSNYIDLNTTSYALGIRRSASYSCWIKPTTNSSMYGISDYGTNGLGMTLRTNSNTSADFYVYPNNHRITYTYNFAPNVWYNLVGVMDSDNIYMYLNGALVASAALAEDIGLSASTLKIGARGDAPAAPGAGYADHVMVHNRALTAAEVKQNFNALRGRYGV